MSKILLETKKGTQNRKVELDKLEGYLMALMDHPDPFNCNLCERFDYNFEQLEQGPNCSKCIQEKIKEIIEEIDKEGIYYF